MALIELNATTKLFERKDGGTAAAVGPVSFEVEQGEFVSIVGPSGCGKTTLLNVVAGLITPTRGSVSLDGRQVNRPSRELSLVFQNPVLLPWRSVLANVLLPCEIFGTHRAKGMRDKARGMLELVGIKGYASAYPSELSGGMQQRVAIARALMLDSSCLLMDEPFGAVDALTREELNVELERIWSKTGRAVLMITHSIQEAVFLSDRVLVMSQSPGHVTADVPIRFDRPRALEEMESAPFRSLCRKVRSHLEVGHTSSELAVGGAIGGQR